MCEITRENFEECFPDIRTAIENSDFIAIDSEFTGLNFDDSSKRSLFDTGEERYKKLKITVKEILPCQIGVSLFAKQQKSNSYEAKTFNFYLLPKAFAGIDIRFMCQISSLEFLCQNNFDFNKFIYSGVTYMNEVQEAQLTHFIKTRQLFGGLDREVDERCIQGYCSQISIWLVSAKDGEVLYLDCETGISTHTLHAEFRDRFPNIWSKTETNRIVIEKVSQQKRNDYETSEDNQEILQEMLGFTRVFRLIRESKKPLIGHNCFMDLLLLYDKFHRPLPDEYHKFKKELHNLFPNVFDTKHISSKMRKALDDTGLLTSTNLSDLYESLNSYKGKSHVLCSPSIYHASGFDKYSKEEHLHEAGYDAYIAGCVFIRLSHIFVHQSIKSNNLRPVPFRFYLVRMNPYLNVVNLIRAASMSLKLDGADPVTARPQWLFVRTKRASYRLNSSQLAQWFSSYGSVDIKMNGSNQAFVAVGNHYCAKDILKAFKKQKDIQVVKYNMWRHSSVGRSIIWTGVAVSSGLCLWVLLRTGKQ